MQLENKGRTKRKLGVLITVLLVAAVLAAVGSSAAEAEVGIQGRVTDDGGAVSGVKIDLFRANGDGSRGAYIRDVRTDGNGWYSFSPGDGCHVITMIAPNGRTFSNGSQWHQTQVCVSGGHTDDAVNGSLQGGTASDPCTNSGSNIWNLEYEDHFSGNGAPVNDAWHIYNSTGNAGYGLRRPSAVSLWNGSLNIKASSESGTLVSGGLSHSLDQTYGKYEFRVRTDKDYSEGTSGVVLTWPQSGVHPRDGENNIYETLATPGDRHKFFSFIHEPYGTVHDQDYTVHYADASQWHTMVMEWTPDQLVLKRDGQTIKTINENNDDLIPDNAHHMTIQLDAWSNWIERPVWMQVDYVKIWSYGGTTSC